MSIFVPVYRAKASQQTFLDREQRLERKRKRARESEGGHEDVPDAASEEVSDARPVHPVSLTDPYYVAGHPRDKPLPGGNFPHAAPSNSGPRRAQPSLEAEFAQVKPAVYVSSTADTVNQSDSLRRRHLDNLTAILHRCMLDGDWSRASRVWGLVLRTEIGGGPIDVRRHGRWTVSAELLMRRHHSGGGSEERNLGVADNDARAAPESFPSDQGFSLAREYYERLILQYPHRVRASRDSVNALVVYPALFNVWIYEVQSRAERARKRLISPSEAESHDDGFDIDDIDHGTAEQMQAICIHELDEAHPILQRLEDLLSAPPFDTSPEILRYRGFVGAWVADIHLQLAEFLSASSGVGSMPEDEDPASIFVNTIPSAVENHRQVAITQRQKAVAAFRRLLSLGTKLSDEICRFIDDTEAANHHGHNHDDHDRQRVLQHRI